jgi:hypothetical protein
MKDKAHTYSRQVWHDVCNNPISNQLNNITMRTKMTLIMTALQGASVLLASLNLGGGNALAAVCFLGATVGVCAAQALDNK